MALAQTLAPVLTIALSDNNGNKSSAKFSLPATVVTVAAALTRANAIRDALAALTNARIEGASLSYSLTEDAPGASVPESEVERKLVFPFVGATPRDRYRVELPSPLFNLELGLTDNVDPADPAVFAFVNAVIANAVTTHGDALTRLAKAPYVDHR